jgi:hypothetical protein
VVVAETWCLFPSAPDGLALENAAGYHVQYRRRRRSKLLMEPSIYLEIARRNLATYRSYALTRATPTST